MIPCQFRPIFAEEGVIPACAFRVEAVGDASESESHCINWSLHEADDHYKVCL